MGRPKKGQRAERRGPSEVRPVIIHLKGTAEYAAWLDELHRKTHIAKATLFRLAMEEWAEKHGHAKPPEM